MLGWVQHLKDASKRPRQEFPKVKNLTAYGVVVGAALAASLAFLETASADMYGSGNCDFNPTPICSAQAGPSQDESRSSALSKTEKDNGFNNGNDMGVDRRQGVNPSSGADRRQEAGS